MVGTRLPATKATGSVPSCHPRLRKPEHTMHGTSDVVELKMSPVGPFYSQLDEDAFFAWLSKIKCVSKFEGRLDVLRMEVCAAQLDAQDLRELLSLFRRYGVDLRQLAVFDREEFADWFRARVAYWYPLVFSNGV
jgi:hypothetical protein